MRPPLFFMHIPRCAGTSMRAFLRSQYPASEVCPAEGWKDLGPLGGLAPAWLAPFNLWQGHFHRNLMDLLPKGTMTLVILRDPVRRTVASIRHTMRDPHYHADHGRMWGRRLQELIRDPEIMRPQTDVQARYLCATADGAYTAHYSMTHRADGSQAEPGDLEIQPTIEAAKQWLRSMMFIGVAEDIPALLDQLCPVMGFDRHALFPRANVNPGGDVLDGLDPEDLAVVRSYVPVDIALYEFARKLIKDRARRPWIVRRVGGVRFC